MAANKRTSTRKLQLVTKGRKLKLSAKQRKNINDWVDENYHGPVELTREQFKQVYDAVLFVAQDYQQTIGDLTSADGKYDERNMCLIEVSEAEFARLNRLLYQLELHFEGEHEPRLNSQFKLRQELMEARARIGGAA